MDNTINSVESSVNKRHVKPRETNLILLGLIKDCGFRTISSFANSLGVSRTYISQILHGHIVPDADMMITISKKLCVDSRTIFKEKGELNDDNK